MSKTDIVINPKFNDLEDFIHNIPNTFDREGECIYDQRNRIKVFEVNGVKINVKRYCIPPFVFNRIVYNLFREPKAMRAYNYAFRLLEMGFQTPMPIAYIIQSDGLFLGYSYFISIHESCPHDIGDYIGKEMLTPEDRNILDQLGVYTAKLHKQGVLHYDYGEGNILFKMVDGEPIFYLLDINRMKFREISVERGCKNFDRLKFSDEMFEVIANGYARARNSNKDEVYKMILKGRKEFIKKRKLKKLKSIRR